MNKKQPSTALVWFRQDLRLSDNPALNHACQHYEQVIPVFIDDSLTVGQWATGAASRWWLHHSLKELQNRLQARQSELIIRCGDPTKVIKALISETAAKAVFWNRRYEPLGIKCDRSLKTTLREAKVVCETFNANLWWEPWELKTQQNKPYRVFTPMWKNMLKYWRFPSMDTTYVLPKIQQTPTSLSVDGLNLLPKVDWDKGFYEHWQPGEKGAGKQLEVFSEESINGYTKARDIPSTPGTSQLASHLHFGEISTRQIIRHLCPDGHAPVDSEINAFIRQLAWREFSWHLLFNYPQLPEQGLQEKFDAFPWRKSNDYQADLIAWQQGKTGVPMVDAGMRQLWKTGWMHNRVRMLVASFLTKNLLIPWQEGAKWFWDTLVDADLANNTQGWQWTAGCGADAAPYFRIFSPVAQGQRFDPNGDYVRRWVPEINAIKGKNIHAPWEIDDSLLAQLGIVLDLDYPRPIVNLKYSRERALAAYQQTRLS